MGEDALPLIYNLVTANIAVTSEDWSIGWAPGMSVDFAKPHLRWLHELLMAMAESGKFTCAARAGDSPSLSIDSPPFTNPGRSVALRLHNEPIEVFSYEVRKALRELAVDIPWRENDPEHRRSWVSRWLGAAALTAHLRLSRSCPPNNVRVPVDAPLGEEPPLRAKRLIEFLETLNPQKIERLPLYLSALAESMQACIDDIRRDFELLQDMPSGSRRRFTCEGRIADLLAACTTIPCDDGCGIWPKKLTERCIRFLVHHQVFQSNQEAAKQLHLIGIISIGSPCIRDGKMFERLANKNSIHQAAMRGREHVLTRLADACNRNGILTSALILHLTRSQPLRERLRLISEGPRTSPNKPTGDTL